MEKELEFVETMKREQQQVIFEANGLSKMLTGGTGQGTCNSTSLMGRSSLTAKKKVVINN